MTEFSAGAMREPITIQTETRTSDGGGGFTQGFSTHFTCFASVRATGGDERYEQGQLIDTQMFEFVIRYRSDKAVTAKNRILWGTRVFQVKRVDNHMERNKYLVIKAEENVAT